MRAFSVLLLPLLLTGCKQLTSMVVGGTVSAGKEVTKGIVEGVEEGRKSGESLDGAVVVTTAAELAEHGSVTVFAVKESGDEADVVLAFENTGDTPLRVSGVEVIALDPDGFVQRPTSSETTLTVPAHAKDQLVVHFAVPAAKVKTVRVWGADYTAPATATTTSAEPDAPGAP